MLFFGEVTPSLLVSSKSIGDLALSRLLEGLLSSNRFPLRIDLCGDTGEVVEAAEAPAAAALKRCCLRPGLRPNK